MATIIIGAGVGGLAAAIALAAKGEPVTVLEHQAGAGGKMLPVQIGAQSFDSGPTVLTMRWVFDELFAIAGRDLNSFVSLQPQQTLARHYWSGGETLDLFADSQETIDAIGRFAGAAEANAFQNFARAARRIHQSLEQSFLKSQRPTPWKLASSMPLRDVLAINPFETLWSALGRFFKDQRLRQLFGRYATYCGSSPFKAPATLMLVADVERAGVWRVSGGMAALANGLESLARQLGVNVRYNCLVEKIERAANQVSAVIDNHGERHPCHAVIVNADSAALAAGLFGDQCKKAATAPRPQDRSLSAFTWCTSSQDDTFALSHHNVFFSDDYSTEFADLEHRPATDPTVYVCNQGDGRKLFLINAPASAETGSPDVERKMLARLGKSGFFPKMQAETLRRSPADFAKLYPATSGALYGRATHGWMSTFTRPQARTKIAGLYLAGGSTHPGPGVPMAALGGMRAAEALMQDRAST